MLVADAGRARGFGHLGRSTGLAAALSARGVRVDCFANGAETPFEVDGIGWAPLADVEHAVADIAVLDSYDMGPGELRERCEAGRVAAFHDEGPFPAADRVVSVGTPPDTAHPGLLAGLLYAPLRAGYWDAGPRATRDRPERVLVATGSADDGSFGAAVADAVAARLPGMTVALVGAGALPEGSAVEAVPRRDSLAGEMAASDLIVTAAGQTMLEAAALGLPAVAVVTAENQRAQAARLAEAGAAELVDGADPDEIASRAAALGADAARRAALSAAAQRSVDGRGAHRVASELLAAAGEPG